MAYEDYMDQDEIDEGPRRQRSLWGLVRLVVAIVVIILLLLMMRGCGSGEAKRNSEGGGKSIEAVSEHDTVDGMISVWIGDDASIDAVLDSSGIAYADFINMGGGRYVVDVPTGTEKASARKVRGVVGVHDTGFVYERP